MTNNDNFNITFDVNKAYDQTVGPLVQRASETIISAWDLTLGTIDYLNEKSKLKRQFNLSEFRIQLESKINEIPRENFIEPEISKVGPALEASKYYFEEEEIRTMFANLIASSMDYRKVNEVYPSFSEIIKQMSKLDAENLKIIYKTLTKDSKICQIKIPIKSGGFRTIFTNVFIDNINNKDYKSNSSSISNLSRLGLIDISYSQFYVDEDIYREFEESYIFQQALLIQEEYNTNHNFLPDDPSSYLRPEVVKGIVSITPFGESFCKICL